MKSTKTLIALAAACLLIGSCKKEETLTWSDQGTTTTTATTVKDIDGNVYNTVTIGTQVWMKENLKVTKYRNGDAIPNITDSAAWKNLTTGAYCSYKNDDATVNTYGRIYNWYVVSDSRNIAPAGWHVASETEWKTLVSYLGGNDVAGGKMKERDTLHWETPNTGATNESGFTALPAGYRYVYNGSFDNQKKAGGYWSTTDSADFAWHPYLRNIEGAFKYNSVDKRSGNSIRCIKD